MSAHHCDRCGRTVPRKRVVETRVGDLCQVCSEHLSKALRRPPVKEKQS